MRLKKLGKLYLKSAEKFMAEEPQFAQAYMFLISNRTEQLSQYLFGKPLAKLSRRRRNEIRLILEKEEIALVRAAVADRRSPAKVIFKLAGHLGWKKRTR